MKLMCMTLFVCALASAGELPQLEGQVVSNGESVVGGFWAQLDITSGGTAAKTAVDPFGRFLFPPVAAGSSPRRIVDARGLEVASQPVNMGTADQRLSVSLSDPPGTRQAGQKVSVAQLRHKPVKAARRLAEE